MIGSAPWPDRAVGAADRLRARVLRATGPVARALALDRDARVGVRGIAAVGAALALVLVVPGWTLALGPLVLGVPHLLADARYLVVRPGLWRSPAFLAACLLPVVAVGVGGPVSVGLAGVVGAAVVGTATPARRWGVAALGVAALVGAVVAPRSADLLLAHGHNLLAVAIFAVWRRPRRWPAIAWIGAFAVVYLALLGGTLDAWVVGAPGPLPLRFHAARIAPGLSEVAARSVLLSFAFAQQVHYAVWLQLIPDEDQARVTPRSVRRTARDLVRDMGRVCVLAICVLCVGLVAWGWLDPRAASRAYFGLARFHAVLELVVIAAWAAGCSRPGPRGGSA